MKLAHLEVVALLRGARLHEVLVLVIQACALEHVEHIMHVGLDEAKRPDGAGEIGVTVIVKICKRCRESLTPIRRDSPPRNHTHLVQ